MIASVGILIGSVGILIGSVGILIGSVGILIGSVGILIGSVGILIGSFWILNCRDYDCRDFDSRDFDTNPLSHQRKMILCRTYMQRIGLIPSDDETSSTSSAVGARFGINTKFNVIF